jgi:iron complex transport system permease protein
MMENQLWIKIQDKRKKDGLILFFFLCVLMAVGLLAVNLGRAEISIFDTLKIIGGRVDPSLLEGIPDSWSSIVWNIRLPRILTGILVGCGLAVSGAVFQALLMNPLADSYTMGVSSGAAFGASVAIFINLFSMNLHLPVTLFAFIGALATLGLVLRIARVDGTLSPSNMIIAGIIVSSIFSAGISFLKSLSGEGVSAIIYWLMGSLSARSWMHVGLCFIVIGICMAICLYYADDLNLMCLGDQEARNLGVDTQRVRRILLISGSLMTAVCVSVSGIIGFIGLIVPHMLRFLVGSDNRILLPLSGLLGGLLLLLADTVTRVLLNIEIPVGVFTTLFGGPFFIAIFLKKNKALF